MEIGRNKIYTSLTLRSTASIKKQLKGDYTYFLLQKKSLNRMTKVQATQKWIIQFGRRAGLITPGLIFISKITIPNTLGRIEGQAAISFVLHSIFDMISLFALTLAATCAGQGTGLILQRTLLAGSPISGIGIRFEGPRRTSYSNKTIKE